MFMLERTIAASAAVLAAGIAHAADSAAPAAAYSPAGSVLQALAGLAAVLLVMWACARLLKRYAPGRQAGAGVMRVLGGVAVGQRERVVMVEVGNTWMVIGVAPGRVSALHVMEKIAGAVPPETAQPGSAFAANLARFLQRPTR